MQQPEALDSDPRETQRAKILDGARRAFARKGRAATMADVAEAAGVSQGLAYRYFASKEDLYRALVNQAMEHAERASAIPDPAAAPAERLAQMITRLVEYRRDHLEVFHLLDQVLRSDKVPADIAAMIRRRRETFLREFRQLIVEGQAAGTVAAGDPDHLVIAISASLEGLVRIGLGNPEQFQQRCPDPGVFLRMLKP